MNNVIFTNKQKLNAIVRKIRFQFPASPEGRLMFAVVESAIKDLLDPCTFNVRSAR